MLTCQTLIVSDLHLGARNSRTADFLAFLDQVATDRLIVNGDLFDRPNLRGMSAEHFQVLEALREHARRSRLDWIVGNHDPDPQWFRDVLRVEAVEETILEVSGQRYLVCHGHRFDPALQLPRLIVQGAEAVYRLAQWMDDTHGVARRLKQGSKRFLHVVEQVRRQAAAYAAERNCNGVILGHTHLSEESRESDIHYVNGGCWTERPGGFVAVADGRIVRGHWLLSEFVATPEERRRLHSRKVVRRTAERRPRGWSRPAARAAT